MQLLLTFNIASILSFSTVVMTFAGLNFYFRNSLHSYASGDTPIFPVWAWISIIVLILLIAAAILKEKYINKSDLSNPY